MVYLTSLPLVANVEMKSPGGSHFYAKFLLHNDTVGRFMEALRRRGVVRILIAGQVPCSLVAGKIELFKSIDEKAQRYLDWFGV